jgi:glucuronokinase
MAGHEALTRALRLSAVLHTVLWQQRKNEVTMRAYARAALVGNPSDGYGGRTIAFTFRDLFAEVNVKRAERLIVDAERGEGALLRAAFGRFAAYCVDAGTTPEPCAISVRSSIPPEVGLAASSAIVVAALRALAALNGLAVADETLPPLALAAEEDLDIPAGLQDRVAQVYEGLVYMDFDRALLADGGHVHCERLEPTVLQHAYVAWSSHARRSSAAFHGELRRRVRSGDREAIDALAEIGEVAHEARDCVERGDRARLDALVDANFDLRRRLGPLEPKHVRMVEVARAAGASANFTGSGGAITGFVDGRDAFAELSASLSALGCTVIRPAVDLAAVA